MTDAIERLMKPLKVLHFPVHEIAMMMSLALRFVPTLLEETDKIMQAQKARGSDFESGGITKRVRALTPILVPLFVSAFRRAYEIATAMECRCYNGGDKPCGKCGTCIDRAKAFSANNAIDPALEV